MSDVTYLDVETWWDEDTDCAVCGDEIHEGDHIVWEPQPSATGRAMVVGCHPACSVRNGYRLRYPGEVQS